MQQGYSADDLKSNRVSVLVFGGTESERKAFAQAAAQALPTDGPLVEAQDDAAVSQALGALKGVIYVSDATKLSDGVQREVVRVLREQEERPKLVLGLPLAPDSALERGLVRDDLHYWLRLGQVDVRQKGRR